MPNPSLRTISIDDIPDAFVFEIACLINVCRGVLAFLADRVQERNIEVYK